MTTVAVLGTGLMGYAMAERFLEVGLDVRVFNRTRAKAEPLAVRGAFVADTAADAVAGADCVFLMLSAADAIRETLFGREPLPQLKWRTVIQSGTISPLESVEIQRRVIEAGGDYMEAPVLGPPAHMRSGSLILMVGATPAQFDSWKDLLANLGPDPLLVGAVGKAAAMKLAFNQLIASHMAAISLSLGFVERHGINPDIFLRILRQSALNTPMFDSKLPRVLQRDFSNPNFAVKHLLKDVNLFLGDVTQMAGEPGTEVVDASALEGVRRILERTMARGLGDCDYSALSEQVREKPAKS